VGKSTFYRQMNEFGLAPGTAALPTEVAPDIELSLADYERMALECALDEAGGNKIAAAKLLRVGKSTLYRKLTQHGIA